MDKRRVIQIIIRAAELYRDNSGLSIDEKQFL